MIFTEPIVLRECHHRTWAVVQPRRLRVFDDAELVGLRGGGIGRPSGPNHRLSIRVDDIGHAVADRVRQRRTTGRDIRFAYARHEMIEQPLDVAVAGSRPSIVRAGDAVRSRCPGPVVGRRQQIVQGIVRCAGGGHTAEAVVGIGLKGAGALPVSLVVCQVLRAAYGELGGIDVVDQLERLVEIILRGAACLAVRGQGVAVVVGVAGFLIQMPGILQVGDGSGLDTRRQFVEKVRDDPRCLAVFAILGSQVVVVVLVVGAVVAHVDVADAHAGIGHERDIVIGPVDELLLVWNGVAGRHDRAEHSRRRRCGATSQSHGRRRRCVVTGAARVDCDATDHAVRLGNAAGRGRCRIRPRYGEGHHRIDVAETAISDGVTHNGAI